MLRGGSVAEPPDDPVVVEAVREVPECAVETFDRAESLQLTGSLSSVHHL